MASFNFTFQEGTSIQQIVGLEIAGKIWGQFLDDDATFNIHVSSSDSLPEGVVGGAVPIFDGFSADDVKEALKRDQSSVEDAIATDNLNLAQSEDGSYSYTALNGETLETGNDLTLTRANAKALGLISPQESEIDGVILIDDLKKTSLKWGVDFSRSKDAKKNRIDLLSVALHEIGHILGFYSSIDASQDGFTSESSPDLSLLDLYRYSSRSSAQNAQEVTKGEKAYFSIDGGTTQQSVFSAGLTPVLGGVEGYQASHWGTEYDLAQDSEKDEFERKNFRLINRLLSFATPWTPEDQVSSLSSLYEGIVETAVLNGLISPLLNVISVAAPGIPVEETPESGSVAKGAFGSVLDFLGSTLPIQQQTELLDGIALGSQVNNESTLLGQEIFLGGTQSIVVSSSQDDADLGIMDPILAPGSRSEISALDLLAFDVLGYDLAGSDLDVNYDGIFNEVQTELAEKLGISEQALFSYLEKDDDDDDDDIGDDDDGNEDLNDVDLDPVTTSSSMDELLVDIFSNNRSLLERRRRKRTSRQSSYWQEFELDVWSVYDLDPKVLNILSDGAGEIAEIAFDSDSDFVTRVEGLYRQPLFFRSVNDDSSNSILGGSLNDIIIPQSSNVTDIDAGEGDNVIYHYGAKGGQVRAGRGDDLVFNIGGSGNYDVGEGDNVLFLNLGEGTTQIRAGSGNDVLLNPSNTPIESDNIEEPQAGLLNGFLQLLFGSGNNRAAEAPTNIVFGDFGEGNNTVQVSEFFGDLDFRTGNGNDVVDLSAAAISLQLGEGNNRARLLGETIDVSAGNGDDDLQLIGRTVTATVGNGDNQVLARDFDTIDLVLGNGNDVIDLNGRFASIQSGLGQDLFILGDRSQAYFAQDRNEDFASIESFDFDDKIQLHGKREDYSLISGQLSYQGDVIASFGPFFPLDLAGDQFIYLADEGNEDLSLSSNLEQDLISEDIYDQSVGRIEFLQSYGRYGTYSIEGGEDAQYFDIDAESGELTFNQAFWANNPLDANLDSKFEVAVKVEALGADGLVQVDRQTLLVQVDGDGVIQESKIPRIEDESQFINTVANNDIDDVSQRLLDVLLEEDTPLANPTIEEEIVDDSNRLLDALVGNAATPKVEENNVGDKNDAGLTLPLTGQGRIGNQVWFDADADGRYDDGEVGVKGIRISLIGAGADGTFSTADDIGRTTYTGKLGRYAFNDLQSGDYQLTFDRLPEGIELTRNDFVNSHKNSDVNPLSGQTDIIRLGEGEKNFRIDAGLNAETVAGEVTDFSQQITNINGQTDVIDLTGISGDVLPVQVLNFDADFDQLILAGQAELYSIQYSQGHTNLIQFTGGETKLLAQFSDTPQLDLTISQVVFQP